MATNIGPKISIDGYSKYRQDMKNITADTKALKAEMQNLEKGYSDTGNKSDTYKQKAENLNKQIENQKKVVEENEQMLAAARKEFDEGSEQVGKYKEAVAKAKTELGEMETKLKALPTPLKEFGDKLQAAGETLEKKGTAISNFGSNLSAKVTVPLTLLGTAAVSAAASFEQVMANVQALSQADPEEMEKLTAMARELGKTTVWSADEVGEGFGYMALAGWSVDSMLSGILPILNLATASGTDLATTSDLVTDALTAFGLSAEDAGHFADVLAQTSRSSNTSVLQMGDAFKYAAPLAGTLGYSVEDVALALGLMANSGIKAETAGTTLRAMFSKLAAPTGAAATLMDSFGLSLVDENGKTKSLATVIDELRTAFQGLSQDEAVAAATTLVGRNAMSGFLAIIGATDTDVESLSKSIKTADGAAGDMAKTMGSTTKSKITQAKNAARDAGIEIGNKLAPYIKTAADKAAELAKEFGTLDTKTQDNILKFGLLAAATGPVITGIGGIVTSVGNVLTGAGKLVNYIALHPLGTVLAVTAAVASWVLINNHINTTKNTTSELTKTADDVKDALSAVNSQLSTAKTNLDNNIAGYEGLETRATELVTKIDELQQKEKLSNEEKAQMKVWVDELNKIYPDLNLEIDENGKSLNKSTEELRSYIAQMKEMAKAEAYYDAMTEAYKAQAAAEAELKRAEEALKKAEEESGATEKERKLLQDQILGITESREQAEKNLKERLDEGKISTDEYNAALEAMDRGEVAINGTTISLSKAQQELIQKEQLNTKQLKGLREAVDLANTSVKDAKEFADSMAGAYETAATNVSKAGTAAETLSTQTGENMGKNFTEGTSKGMTDTTAMGKVTKSRGTVMDAMKTKGIFDEQMGYGRKSTEGNAAGMTAPNTLAKVNRARGTVMDAMKAKGIFDEQMGYGRKSTQGAAAGMSAPTEVAKVTKAKGTVMDAMKNKGIFDTQEDYGRKSTQGTAAGMKAEKELSKVRSARDEVKGAATPNDMYDQGKSAGKATVEGMQNGLTATEAFREAARNLAQSAITSIKKKLGIASPSKVAKELGEYTGEGFILGLNAESAAVAKAAERTFDIGMMGGVSPGFNSVGTSNTTVNLTVNGAPGQDVRELADIIEDRIAFNIRNREAAFA